MTEILVPESQLKQIILIDETCRSAATQIQAAQDSGNQMLKTMVMARAMNAISGLLTKEIMADIMQLQGKAIGFKTDKDSEGGYPLEKVREVVVQALIRKCRVTGNEFNIIAGNFYPTKEGFERLLREFPGLTNLQISLGVPPTPPQMAHWSPQKRLGSTTGRRRSSFATKRKARSIHGSRFA